MDVIGLLVFRAAEMLEAPADPVRCCRQFDKGDCWQCEEYDRCRREQSEVNA